MRTSGGIRARGDQEDWDGITWTVVIWREKSRIERLGNCPGRDVTSIITTVDGPGVSEDWVI